MLKLSLFSLEWVWVNLQLWPKQTLKLRPNMQLCYPTNCAQKSKWIWVFTKNPSGYECQILPKCASKVQQYPSIELHPSIQVHQHPRSARISKSIQMSNHAIQVHPNTQLCLNIQVHPNVQLCYPRVQVCIQMSNYVRISKCISMYNNACLSKCAWIFNCIWTSNCARISKCIQSVQLFLKKIQVNPWLTFNVPKY